MDIVAHHFITLLPHASRHTSVLWICVREQQEPLGHRKLLSASRLSFNGMHTQLGKVSPPPVCLDGGWRGESDCCAGSRKVNHLYGSSSLGVSRPRPRRAHIVSPRADFRI